MFGFPTGCFRNIARLRKKLEALGLEEFILTKKGIGYRLG